MRSPELSSSGGIAHPQVGCSLTSAWSWRRA